MKLKKILFTVFLIFSISSLYGQTAANSGKKKESVESKAKGDQKSSENENTEDEKKDSFFADFWKSVFTDEENDESENLPETEKTIFDNLSFCLGLTPSVFINTRSSTISAPSPIFYPVYIGFIFPQEHFAAVQPSLKFFSSNYFVNDDLVLPAEIENRTVTAYSVLLDLPILFKIDFFNKVDFRVSGGIAFLLRYGFLSSGVSESDWGYYGTAAEDRKYINDWFYSKLRYIYLSAGFSSMFRYGKLKFGPEANVYAPVSILTDYSFDAIILSMGLKIIF